MTMTTNLDAYRARGLAADEVLGIMPTTDWGVRGKLHAARYVAGVLLPVCGARPRANYRVSDASAWGRRIECDRCRARARKAGRLPA
ncbi:hypothetical protein I5G67_gp090 [Mycobacterium phage Aminay]|uniref:Uncharacterized protein n=1 Tax=Mycobacterium phage Aminay TaxID=2250291 RepID=A0A345KV74_9CAUD|nr:hypothetical protein I5G67_gp090 [Mycobacterium phage Aminay]AXH46926.1 hypothetical protein SEA_AMINAY_90 [Mycobacterium phage Aminay]